MMSVLTRVAKVLRGEWRYKGVTNRFMDKHAWTNGDKTVEVYHHPAVGIAAQVVRRGGNVTLQLSNGSLTNMEQAMVLADLYIRDDAQNPAAFMHSDRVESEYGSGNSVRQDGWLAAHTHDYEFAIIDPQKVRETL